MSASSPTIDPTSDHVSALQNRHREELSDFLVQRFLSGVCKELLAHPSVESVWVGLGTKTSPDWLRAAAQGMRHDMAVAEQANPREARAFYKALGAHREAISSNDQDHQSLLRQRLPCWSDKATSTQVSREQFMAVAELFKANPKLRLTQEAWEPLVAQFHLEAALPSARPPSRPRV